MSLHWGFLREISHAAPPRPSSGILHDLNIFVARRPAIETLVDVRHHADRDDYAERIRQRLGIHAAEYAVLNIHRIGIEAPRHLIFEELVSWHDASVWWPNHLATLRRTNGSPEHLRVCLFGLPGGLLTLFRMNMIRIRPHPGPGDFDNARYVLYETNGGYPIGFFCMYVRSPIAQLGEAERSQLFFAVAFDFYGRKDWPHRRVINPLWEWVHNRSTANILNRIKRVCEWRFERLENGE